MMRRCCDVANLNGLCNRYVADAPSERQAAARMVPSASDTLYADVQGNVDGRSADDVACSTADMSHADGQWAECALTLSEQMTKLSMMTLDTQRKFDEGMCRMNSAIDRAIDQTMRDDVEREELDAS